VKYSYVFMEYLGRIAVLLFFLVLCGQTASGQPQLDSTKREQGSHSFSAQEFVRNLHPSYSVSYMGPYLGSGPGTYNIYLTDFASTQLYHSVRLGFQVSDDLQVGVGEDIVNNIETVMNPEGRTYRSSFERYDPYVYFNLPRRFDLQNWGVFTSVSFSLPFSNASQASGKLTNLVFSQVWTHKKVPSPWKAGFRYYLNPSIYQRGLSLGVRDRQTFYASFGHILGYQLSPAFALMTTTHFDVEHRTPNSSGFFHLKRSLPDFWQTAVTYSPKVDPALLSIGVYVQGLIWAPTLDTSIVGAQFSVGI
jgi:hypothetical protein